MCLFCMFFLKSGGMFRIMRCSVFKKVSLCEKATKRTGFHFFSGLLFILQTFHAVSSNCYNLLQKVAIK